MARRGHYRSRTTTASKETEHDRDLRFLRATWGSTCDSARKAFAEAPGLRTSDQRIAGAEGRRSEDMKGVD